MTVDVPWATAGAADTVGTAGVMGGRPPFTVDEDFPCCAVEPAGPPEGGWLVDCTISGVEAFAPAAEAYEGALEAAGGIGAGFVVG